MDSLYQAITSGTHSAYDIDLFFVGNDAENDINRMCYRGFTPLCAACKANRADLVSLLLHKGATANKQSKYFRKYPLHFACAHSHGNLDIVNMLLANGAEANVQDQAGNTPLHLACNESSVPVVKSLLAAGAEVHLEDMNGETALVRACFAKSVELIDILLKAGSDPNICNGYPLSVVIRAPSLELVEGVKLLIAAGAEITTSTYLSFASEENHLDIMKILHNHGADVHDTESGLLRLTALHSACISQAASHEAVNLLLQWGADPNQMTKTGETALHFACQNFAFDKVRVLLMYGAHVNQVDGTDVSPLISALITQRDEDCASCINLIQLLFAAGARLLFPVFEQFKSLIIYRQGSTTDNEELFQLLTKHATQPSSLQCQCRAVIRSKIKGNIDQEVEKLPLPKPVIAYLQFSDVAGYTDYK